MSELKHVVLRNQWINGWEYGILRAFENTISKVTGADIINYPDRRISPGIINRIGHGMNNANLRSFLPKQDFKIETDVLWVILMGPENFELDLYKGWQKSAKKKIVYLCDTLPSQMKTIKRLFSNNDFDLCITAFEEAVPMLEKTTGRKWIGIVQSAPAELFTSPPFEERLIHFSNYGRRFPEFHQALIDFSTKNKLYYDYTTHDGKHPTADAVDLYKQYAWHVSHSLFNVSWAVELTHPERAGYLRPITARWFEAALSGCIIIGKKPSNPNFYKDLSPGLIEEINPFDNKNKLIGKIEELWDNRVQLFEKSQHIREKNKERWSWENRVNSILNML